MFMEINRRALYNSLRANWMLNSSLAVEPWQIEDYRSIPLEELFLRLMNHGLHLEKISFCAFADLVDSPEELTESLTADFEMDEKSLDQIYLLIFELWRRLVVERPSLTIFCDEIDHQIYLYDSGQIHNEEAIQDALANLQIILDENVDEGTDPLEAFEYMNEACANDLESFLLDYISEQIDNDHLSYASDLIEGFGAYVHHIKWFELLRARVLAFSEPEEANHIIQGLIEDIAKENDLEFILEVLSYFVRSGDEQTFKQLVKKAGSLLQTEDDFQVLVSICADFYHRLDLEHIENKFQNLLDKRVNFDLDKKIDRNDPELAGFLKNFSAT